jgi:hypothetical protein
MSALDSRCRLRNQPMVCLILLFRGRRNCLAGRRDGVRICSDRIFRGTGNDSIIMRQTMLMSKP